MFDRHRPLDHPLRPHTVTPNPGGRIVDVEDSASVAAHRAPLTGNTDQQTDLRHQADRSLIVRSAAFSDAEAAASCFSLRPLM